MLFLWAFLEQKRTTVQWNLAYPWYESSRVHAEYLAK
jgi:hypothetical protein